MSTDPKTTEPEYLSHEDLANMLSMPLKTVRKLSYLL